MIPRGLPLGDSHIAAFIVSASSAIAASCKSVSSCEEAVALWCGGYARADGDSDGVPCENVCHSKEQVDEIKKAIGCK
jgi:hypothetical protein